MNCSVRLLLLSSICPLVLFTVLFLFGFLNLWLYLLFFFFTVCTSICCCLLAFSLGPNQRPATLQTRAPSVTSETDIPSSSSPPPSPLRKLTYDVFLSFRGVDTRYNFTDNLYTALTQRGISTYRDDEELKKGESIGPNLLKAIEESRYAIVIFSKSYANSSWCLDEIAKVADCMKDMGQEAFPVFYHIHPSEVRWQSGDYFGKAFEKHQKRFQDDKVKRWKVALNQVANLSGCHIEKNGYDSKYIQEIVQLIFTKLNKIIFTSKGLVGMDSHLHEMLSYLDIGCPDVRIIGICGMGGIGKTTIAEAVYEKIQPQFEGYCFLKNVREVTEKKGVDHLQKQLLSKLLKIDVNVEYTNMGTKLIMNRVLAKKVLIVLDDVDQAEQLEALCDRTWFGPGSRIIITSRDEHLLSVAEGDQVYQVRPLTDAQAFELFSMKAFKKDQLIGEDTAELVKDFLYYADGLPLAIKVLGSSVKGRSLGLWPSMLDRLKENPEKNIIKVLRVSYDGLEQREKQIFLDIACFFKGENIDRVRRILQGKYASCPDIDIQVLLEKSMVTLFGKKLWMHDLINELGWEVVRQECHDEPGGRSRLWISNEIIYVLDRGKATGAVQSISLLSPTKDDVVHSLNAFAVMDNLRLLKIWNVKFPGTIQCLSNKLQYLEWYECPLKSFPSDFQPDNLVQLQMHSSCIQQLWTGGKGWKMLRFIDLRGSRNLISTPDFTEVLGLEILELEDCTSLVEVHGSLGLLKYLTSLNMRNCKLVKSIPPFTCLESLQFLNLSLCSSLKEFPEIEGNMNSLFELHLEGTSFEVLPTSFEKLNALTTLDLIDCKNLLRLPSTMQFSTSLKSLSLTGCSKLVKIPENLIFVEYLDLGGTSISELSFLVGMKNLKNLSCTGCKGLASEPRRDLAQLLSLTCLTSLDLSHCNLMDKAIPSDLSSLVSLTYLNLGGNRFVRLPESISQLSKLESLDLSNCTQLQLVPKLPSSVRHVSANDCTSLTDYPNQFKILASRESGVTTIDSLNSPDGSAPKDAQVWRVRGSTLDGHTMRFVWRSRRIGDAHMEWEKQVDHLSAARSSQMDIALISSIDPISCAIVDDVIPVWFSTISTRNFISIRLPPYLRADNKWRGVAVCAVFAVKGHDTMSLVKPDSDTSYFQCTLTTDIFHMKLSFLDWKEELQPFRSFSHVLSIFYVPYWQFPKSLIQATVMSARFETNNSSMEIQECGIRLVYEQDDGWFAKLFVAGTFTRLNEVQTAIGNSGWLSRADTFWKWEPHTQLPCDQDSSTIVLRKNIESVLPRYLEAVQHTVVYKFNLSGCPGWCYGSMNTFDNRPFKLPPNLHMCKKWMGIVVYGSMEEKELHTIKDDYYVYLMLRIGRYHKIWRQRFVRSSEETHQLWFVYIPRAAIIREFTQISETILNMGFGTDSPVGVVQSGVNIVDQVGVEAFAEAIVHCMQRVDTLDHDKLVVRDWIDLIRLQGRMCTPSTQFSRNRRERKFELLSQKYKNWDWSTSPFYCKYYGAEISKQKWFVHFDEGNSSEIKMPENMLDGWLGIALCARYHLAHEYLEGVILDDPESDVHVLKWKLEHDVARAGKGPFKTEVTIGKLRPWEPSADWTCFMYVPRTVLNLRRQCSLTKASFWSSSPCLGIHSCALRLVYKEDIRDLVQILTLRELP